MILLDTSGLLANYDRSDRNHSEVMRVLAQPQRRILSPFVLAELDYLVSEIAGQREEAVLPQWLRRRRAGPDSAWDPSDFDAERRASAD